MLANREDLFRSPCHSFSQENLLLGLLGVQPEEALLAFELAAEQRLAVEGEQVLGRE